jgi:hypothetical protein
MVTLSNRRSPGDGVGRHWSTDGAELNGLTLCDGYPGIETRHVENQKKRGKIEMCWEERNIYQGE